MMFRPKRGGRLLCVLLGRTDSLGCVSALADARRSRRPESESVEGSRRGGGGGRSDGGESPSPVRSITSGGGVGGSELYDEGDGDEDVGFSVDMAGIL